MCVGGGGKVLPDWMVILVVIHGGGGGEGEGGFNHLSLFLYFILTPFPPTEKSDTESRCCGDWLHLVLGAVHRWNSTDLHS